MTKAKKKAKERERDALVDNHAQVISLLGRVLQQNVASSEEEDVVPPLAYASSVDEAETIARKGDRWDDAENLSALKVRLLCRSKSWVVDSGFPGNEHYPWSQRLVAMRKIGLLKNEQEIATALRKKHKKRLENDDLTGSIYSVQLPVSERLTPDTFKELDRFTFLSCATASQLESRSLSALAEIQKEDREIALFKVPVFPTQTTVGWATEKNPSDDLKRLYSQSVALNQVWRTVAFAANEVIRACRPQRMTEGSTGSSIAELSERRAKLISNALESSLHMLNAQIRHANVRANKLLGVADEVFESLSRHRDVGRGSVTDSMTAALLERKRSIARSLGNEKGASSTQDGARGGNKTLFKAKKKKRKRKSQNPPAQPDPKNPRKHPNDRDTNKQQPQQPKRGGNFAPKSPQKKSPKAKNHGK